MSQIKREGSFGVGKRKKIGDTSMATSQAGHSKTLSTRKEREQRQLTSEERVQKE